VDGCPLVAADSMEIQKVRSFLLQIRKKDHAAALAGIVRAMSYSLSSVRLASSLTMFPAPLKNQIPKATPKNRPPKHTYPRFKNRMPDVLT